MIDHLRDRLVMTIDTMDVRTLEELFASDIEAQQGMEE